MHVDLRILHATSRFVVVNKPPGLLSVPGKGEANQDCVASRVREAFPDATGPLTVHRLDMETSGLMVLALDAEAHRDLSRQFEHRTARKRYVGVVDGILPELQGEVGLPIRADIDRRPLQIVDPVSGRPSLTRWRVLRNEGECTRVELEPVTGRTHQLRLHMDSMGHAILGDRLYGEQPRIRDMAPRLLLHASELAFDAPGGGRVSFTSEPEF